MHGWAYRAEKKHAREITMIYCFFFVWKWWIGENDGWKNGRSKFQRYNVILWKCWIGKNDERKNGRSKLQWYNVLLWKCWIGKNDGRKTGRFQLQWYNVLLWKCWIGEIDGRKNGRLKLQWYKVFFWKIEFWKNDGRKNGRLKLQSDGITCFCENVDFGFKNWRVCCVLQAYSSKLRKYVKTCLSFAKWESQKNVDILLKIIVHRQVFRFPKGYEQRPFFPRKKCT